MNEELRDMLAARLLSSYRFVLAYPNSLDTVFMDAEAMLEEIEDAGYKIVKVDE